MTMIVRDRVAMIGAGHVGSTAAFALMLRALFREIVLVDADEALAQAQAADLRDANALARPARIWAGDYADAASAGIVILTAGAATHGTEDRLSVATHSAQIVADCVDRLAETGFAGILLVAANPVDIMSLVAFERAGLPSARVIGTGTLLDTCRLRQNLGAKFGVSPASVHGMIVGEHGNSEVAAFSTISIGGLPLSGSGFAGIVEIGLRLTRRDFLGRVEDRDMAANDLGFGPALDTFGAAVPHGDPALGVEHVNRVIRGAVDEQPEFIGIGCRAPMLAHSRSRGASRFHHRGVHVRLNEFVRRRAHRMTVSIAFPIDRMKSVGGTTTPLIESPFQPTCANWRSTRRSN